MGMFVLRVPEFVSLSFVYLVYIICQQKFIYGELLTKVLLLVIMKKVVLPVVVQYMLLTFGDH